MRSVRLLVLALILPTTAWAGKQAETEPEPAAQAQPAAIDAAVALLSRYPAGLVPVDPGVMNAIRLLAEQGSREEVSLLRSLVDNERDEVRDAASQAIASIRGRQREGQREQFAGTLPDWPELTPTAEGFRAKGLGREEAVCAAYAVLVLGEPEAETVAQPVLGDAEMLLASGRPRKALRAAAATDSQQGRLLEARAREDLGDVDGAVYRYALLAATGDDTARRALDGFGIDAERLLLGLLTDPRVHEARLIEVLVHHGGDLTVAVFAERANGATGSDRATATDALARMLDPEVRELPLASAARRDAHLALARASQNGPQGVRDLANDALKETASR